MKALDFLLTDIRHPISDIWNMAQPTRRRLPPLNALRAFEAVARSLSFTKAADQLLVTQSAVSRQVKNLEDILGVQLLKRKGPLELTEEGRKLLPVLTGSFDKIAEVIAGIKATHANPPLTLSLPPTFARRMMMPRLADFQRKHPDLEIRIDTPPSNVEFATAPVDMAIFFGSNTVDALIVDLLMREEFTAVCSPRLAAGAGNDLAQFIRTRPLLHVRQGEDLYQCWSIFAAQSGLEDLAVDRGIVLETADLVIESAINDGGVGMLDPRLLPEELKSGRLVTPFKTAVKSGRSYFLVSRVEEIEIPRIVAFRAWVIEQFANSDQISEYACYLIPDPILILRVYAFCGVSVRSSPRAWRTICHPPLMLRLAMMAATIRSGQPVPVPNTPAAAASTARLPIASLREQIQTDRMLESPVRKRNSISATAAFASRARTPTTPMTSAWGSVPASACQTVDPMTHRPRTSRPAPLARQRAPASRGRGPRPSG